MVILLPYYPGLMMDSGMCVCVCVFQAGPEHLSIYKNSQNEHCMLKEEK